jgi:hypothetical protein
MTSRLAFVALMLMACHAPSRSTPDPSRCGPTVPETAQHPLATPVAALAGEYDLIQVQTQPNGSTAIGRLHLGRPDSAARAGAIGGSMRDLVGWYEGEDNLRIQASSRNSHQPGVVLAGSHLRLGDTGGGQLPSRSLTITAVAPEGFWGWWQAQPGLRVERESASRRVMPDPAGYFCALRVEPEFKGR